MSDSPRKDSLADEAESRPESVLPWRRQIEQMRETRRTQFLRVSRKMLNHLCSIGLSGAQEMLAQFDEADPQVGGVGAKVPGTRLNLEDSPFLSGVPFEMATEFLGD